MLWLTGTVVILAALAGIGLTFITLPGIWIAVAIALICTLITPDLLGPWSLGAAVGIAILAEVAEFLASAAGTRGAGGSRAGAMGSIIGSLIGLVVGTAVLAFLPVLGSIIGAVIGAGIGAVVAERGVSGRTWASSWRSGQGAMAGRALSIVVKGLFAVAAAAALIIGALA